MEIQLIQKGHPLWEKTACFAESCSWRAGAFLAERTRENRFQPWERVIIALDGGQIAGFCTLTEKDELPDDAPFSPFIGFVFVDEQYRGNRLSEQMIRSALSYAKESGCQAVYIVSGEQGLYEKYGFEKTGDYETIYGTAEQLFQIAV